MVNPGGTGRPRFVISARLAPLPPSRSLRSRFPSLKSYTNLGTVNSSEAVLAGSLSGGREAPVHRPAVLQHRAQVLLRPGQRGQVGQRVGVEQQQVGPRAG